ncbi:hypothetical protein NDU88_007256 [Pleurodeles waltl]|uniref:Uncharacterized protein n=1 Tax=Pleurodeles waltl TaxID=8319 RepID=A0AAV7MFM5_PLEWA|nr:hypothetical protein NDU88_007256 [Pleurodeles waltl]
MPSDAMGRKINPTITSVWQRNAPLSRTHVNKEHCTLWSPVGHPRPLTSSDAMGSDAMSWQRNPTITSLLQRNAPLSRTHVNKEHCTLWSPVGHPRPLTSSDAMGSDAMSWQRNPTITSVWQRNAPPSRTHVNKEHCTLWSPVGHPRPLTSSDAMGSDAMSWQRNPTITSLLQRNAPPSRTHVNKEHCTLWSPVGHPRPLTSSDAMGSDAMSWQRNPTITSLLQRNAPLSRTHVNKEHCTLWSPVGHPRPLTSSDAMGSDAMSWQRNPTITSVWQRNAPPSRTHVNKEHCTLWSPVGHPRPLTSSDAMGSDAMSWQRNPTVTSLLQRNAPLSRTHVNKEHCTLWSPVGHPRPLTSSDAMGSDAMSWQRNPTITSVWQRNAPPSRTHVNKEHCTLWSSVGHPRPLTSSDAMGSDAMSWQRNPTITSVWQRNAPLSRTREQGTLHPVVTCGASSASDLQ